MELIRIEPIGIQTIFPYVVKYLEKPLDRTSGENSLNDIYSYLINGQQQLWVLIKKDVGIIGACTTQFVDYPQFRIMSIPLVGTEPHTIKEWFEYTMNDKSPLMQWAKENNAKYVEGYVREGWVKFTEKYNFKKYHTTIKKEL